MKNIIIENKMNCLTCKAELNGNFENGGPTQTRTENQPVMSGTL